MSDIFVEMVPSSTQEKLDLMDALVEHFLHRPGALSTINSKNIGVRSWQALCAIRHDYKVLARREAA